MNNREVETYIKLKHFPIQPTKEYFNSLPKGIVELLYDKCLQGVFLPVNEMHDGIRIYRLISALTDPYATGTTSVWYKDITEALEDLLIKYRQNG